MKKILTFKGNQPMVKENLKQNLRLTYKENL